MHVSELCYRTQTLSEPKTQKVGKEQSKVDIDQCMQDADTYLESDKGKQMARGAGHGAAFGAVTGAAMGLFTGNIGRGALRGGVVGGAAGGAAGALSPDQVKHNYVNQCLSEKGYRVIGWN